MAFVKQQKRRAASLEGDGAQARLARFGGDFLLSHYFLPPCKRQRIEASLPSHSDSTASNSDQSPGVLSEDVNQIATCDSPDETRTSIGHKSHPTISLGTEGQSVTQDKPDVLSTQPEYDLFHGWGVYKTNLREYNTASTDHINFAKYRNAPSDIRNCKWLCVFYPRKVCVETIAQKLDETFPYCIIDVASVSDAVVVFIYKDSQRNIRSLLTLDGLGPERILVASFGKGIGRSQSKNAQKDLIIQFQQIPGNI